jgi:hypothetical protein
VRFEKKNFYRLRKNALAYYCAGDVRSCRIGYKNCHLRVAGNTFWCPHPGQHVVGFGQFNVVVPAAVKGAESFLGHVTVGKLNTKK